MKFVPVVCPKCGANLNVEEGRKECFCSYCGTKIVVDNENSKESTNTYVRIDEARIREAEAKERIRLKELELMEERQRHDIERENREYEEKQKKKKRRKIITLVIICIMLSGSIIYRPLMILIGPFMLWYLMHQIIHNK